MFQIVPSFDNTLTKASACHLLSVPVATLPERPTYWSLAKDGAVQDLKFFYNLSSHSK